MHNQTDFLGQCIRNARTNLKMTQDDLSKRLGISLRYLVSLECNQKKPSYALLLQIIKELSISPNEIFHSPSTLGKNAHTNLAFRLEGLTEYELGVLNGVLDVILSCRKHYSVENSLVEI